MAKVVTLDVIEARFKKNLIIAQETMADYVQDAIDKGIIDSGMALILAGAMPIIENYLSNKTGEYLIENFIHSSFSEADKAESVEFKERKYPEYWKLLAQLPTLDEYNRDQQSFENNKPIKPLSAEAEAFFIQKLRIVFPKVEPFQNVIAMLYQYKYPNGKPFVNLLQKKFVAMIFRSFAVLSIKYINLKRNPKIENGKLICNEATGKIQYMEDKHNKFNLFYPNISIKNAMIQFEITTTDLIH